MNALIVPLKLESPLLLTGISNGEENSSKTLSYIPGSALRGALVQRYSSSEKDLLKDETAQKLFFSDQVRYLNAYPAADLNFQKRSLPTPSSWRQEKGVEIEDAPTIYDFALLAADDFEENVRYPFCSPDLIRDPIDMVSPVEVLATHIGGEERGIVKTANNTVFQYQALAEGQVYIAVILTETEQEEITKLLEKDPILYLGRSRSAGYGRVRLGTIETCDDWQEFPQNEPDRKTIITLLSDVLIRDENGQPTHDLDHWLTHRLGQKTQLKSEARFIKSGLVGGFNRKWGMPLPQTPSLGMGSVYVYAAEHLNPQLLKDLVDAGIGERRGEGFGRIAVNWQEPETIRIRKLDEPQPALFTSLSPASQELARKMAERILRQRLDVYLMDVTNDYLISGSIKNHQLARLRNLLRQMINTGSKDTSKVATFLSDLRPNAQDQFRRSRVKQNGKDVGRLLNWLQQRLTQKDVFATAPVQVPEVAGQKADLNNAIKTEYTLRFIEAVIYRQMKADWRES